MCLTKITKDINLRGGMGYKVVKKKWFKYYPISNCSKKAYDRKMWMIDSNQETIGVGEMKYETGFHIITDLDDAKELFEILNTFNNCRLVKVFFKRPVVKGSILVDEGWFDELEIDVIVAKEMRIAEEVKT